MTFETSINSQQMAYFRRRLLSWRDDLVSGSGETACYFNKSVSFDVTRHETNVANRQTASSQSPDDRKQKLIHKIDETLHRIKAGTYGA